MALLFCCPVNSNDRKNYIWNARVFDATRDGARFDGVVVWARNLPSSSDRPIAFFIPGAVLEAKGLTKLASKTSRQDVAFSEDDAMSIQAACDHAFAAGMHDRTAVGNGTRLTEADFEGSIELLPLSM